MSNGYSATGSVIVGDKVLTARSGYNEAGCFTMSNAKYNVIKSLCNKMRNHLENNVVWIQWKMLSPEKQKMWLNKVSSNLFWIEINVDRNATLQPITIDEFSTVLEGGCY